MIAPAEASANLARFDGVRYGLREDADDLTEMYERTRSAGFGAEVKRRIMLGTYALSAGYYDAYYGQAQRVRTKIAEDFRNVFERFDFVVTPTSPTVAFPIGARANDPLAMYMSDYCTVPMPLAGIPAISIPAGLAEPADGGPELPVGFQIAGPAFSESAILDSAFALEKAIGFDAVSAGGRRREPRLSHEECREAAQQALDSLPPELAGRLGEVAVIVEDSHPDGIMGIYDPVGDVQRIVIFRDHNPNAEEVRLTVLHEVGHFFGMDEEQLIELGYG